MEMYEYIVGRGGGRLTDRELCAELGLSKGMVYRTKRELKKAGMSYTAGSHRGGTWYEGKNPVGKNPGAKNPGAKKPGAKAEIYYINNISKREREMRVRAREAACEDAVLAAWAKYRGRALIEDEELEMLSWAEKIGVARLVELIAKAWDRCTADRMSMHYVRHYFIEPELSGSKKPGAKTPGAKRMSKHEPAAVKVTATKNRSEENDKGRSKGAAEKAAYGIRKATVREVEPGGFDGNPGGGTGNATMPRMQRAAVSEKDELGKDAMREPRKREDIHFLEGLPLLPILGGF